MPKNLPSETKKTNFTRRGNSNVLVHGPIIRVLTAQTCTRWREAQTNGYIPSRVFISPKTNPTDTEVGATSQIRPSPPSIYTTTSWIGPRSPRTKILAQSKMGRTLTSLMRVILDWGEHGVILWIKIPYGTSPSGPESTSVTNHGLGPFPYVSGTDRCRRPPRPPPIRLSCFAPGIREWERRI